MPGNSRQGEGIAALFPEPRQCGMPHRVWAKWFKWFSLCMNRFLCTLMPVAHGAARHVPAGAFGRENPTLLRLSGGFEARAKNVMHGRNERQHATRGFRLAVSDLQQTAVIVQLNIFPPQ